MDVSGIYLLKFVGTNKVYVGRSKNINLRFSQHKSMFKANTASQKMQEAYNTYGMPELSVIYAGTDSLEELEQKYIKEYNSVDEGFNTRAATSGGHSGLWGHLNGRSKYTNEQIANSLFLLISDYNYTYPIIEEKTGVAKTTLVDIVNGTGHKWLKTYFPEEYSQLLSFRHRRRSRMYMKAVSPEGVIYTVEHLSDFCREHNLPAGNISRLLRGKCKTYAKWSAIP